MKKIKSFKVYIITSDVVEKFYLYDATTCKLLGRFKRIEQHLQIDLNLFIKLNSLVSIERTETDSIIMSYNATLLES